MTELIDKWEVVNKLIQLENNYQFYKEQWDADVLYRRICELEIGIGKTPGVTVQGDKDINVLSKWISVKDRLPEEPLQTVLVTNGSSVCVGVYSVVYEEFGVMYGRGQDKRFGVTHWMPLPKPPKGE